MSLKLSTKLTIIMAFILLIFVIAFASVFSIMFSQHAKNVEQARIETRLLNLADNISRHTKTDDLVRTYHARNIQIANTLDSDELWIIDKNTLKIIGSKDYPKLVYNQLPPAAAKDIQQIFSGAHITSNNFNIFTENLPYTSGVPILNKQGQIIGAVLLHYKLPNIYESWYDSLGIIIFTSLIVYILLVLILFYWVKHSTHPLKVFNSYISRLEKGDYNIKLKPKGCKETKSLATKLNSLSTYLATTKQQQIDERVLDQTLLINSAYEAYNGVKQLEITLRDIKPYLNKSIPKKLVKKLAVADRHLVKSTTHLFTRTAEDLIGFNFSLINLLEPLQDALNIHQYSSSEHNINFELVNSLDNNVILVNGDIHRLKQMFSILLELNLKQLPDNSNVKIDVTEDSSRYFLTFTSEAYKDLATEHSLDFIVAKHLAQLQGIECRFETNKDLPCYRIIIIKA